VQTSLGSSPPCPRDLPGDIDATDPAGVFVEADRRARRLAGAGRARRSGRRGRQARSALVSSLGGNASCCGDNGVNTSRGNFLASPDGTRNLGTFRDGVLPDHFIQQHHRGPMRSRQSHLRQPQRGNPAAGIAIVGDHGGRTRGPGATLIANRRRRALVGWATRPTRISSRLGNLNRGTEPRRPASSISGKRQSAGWGGRRRRRRSNLSGTPGNLLDERSGGEGRSDLGQSGRCPQQGGPRPDGLTSFKVTYRQRCHGGRALGNSPDRC
jgi:hypothetical protein